MEENVFDVDGGLRSPTAGLIPPATIQAVAPNQQAVAPNQQAVVPIQPVGVPIQPVVAPNQQAVAPIQPGVAPIQPGVAPIQPAVAPIQPAVAPIQPAVAPIQPAVAPIQPAVAPIPAAVAPIQAVVAPIQPAVAPIQHAVLNLHLPVAAPDVQDQAVNAAAAAWPVEALHLGVQDPAVMDQHSDSRFAASTSRGAKRRRTEESVVDESLVQPALAEVDENYDENYAVQMLVNPELFVASYSAPSSSTSSDGEAMEIATPTLEPHIASAESRTETTSESSTQNPQVEVHAPCDWLSEEEFTSDNQQTKPSMNSSKSETSYQMPAGQ